MSEKLRLNPLLNNFEQGQLTATAVGVRVFKVGDFDEASLAVFKHQVDTVSHFVSTLGTLTPKPPQVKIISNEDLSSEGKEVLEKSGLGVVWVSPVATKRRARLGATLIGENSTSNGDFSYVDMLNSVQGGLNESRAIFTSYDITARPETLYRQMVGMQTVYDAWEKKKPGGLAIVGSMLGGVHDFSIPQGAIDGTTKIAIENVSRAFPNNALSMVSQDTHFSGIADNALAGKVEINGKLEPVGGNEDFEHAFEGMLFRGQDAVLLIDPCVENERVGEVKGIEAKYERRKTIYMVYANRLVDRLRRVPLPEERQKPEIADVSNYDVANATLTEHLFFARIDENGKPEVLLTVAQKEKGIQAPI